MGLKDQFLLNPDITYLNHGSFGACPKPVFEDYQNWQVKLERDPVKFMVEDGMQALEISKSALGKYIGAEPDDLIMVPNPTTAFNIVIKNMRLKAGDEILTTNQEYGAMDRTWHYYCQQWGAKYVHADIALPLTTKEAFLNQFWASCTAQTKVIFISEITSPTGLIFPAKEICEEAKKRGLITIVDGAHVPGHIPLNLKEMKADMYTGACHKWLLSPKGCSFLYVKKEFQSQMDPLLVSWGYEAVAPGKSTYLDYHTYQGTRDFAAFLTLPASFKFFEDFNWEDKVEKSKALIREYYPQLAEVLESNTLCDPNSTEFLGQLCSVPIQTTDPIALKNTLYNEFKIEIPVFTMPGVNGNPNQTFLRMSINGYNTPDEIESLFSALTKIKRTTNLL